MIIFLEKYIDRLDIYNIEELIDFCNLCFKIILELQSPSRNDITYTNFQEIKCKSYENIFDVVVDIFRFIYEENEIVFREIYNNRIMKSIGINIFLKK